MTCEMLRTTACSCLFAWLPCAGRPPSAARVRSTGRCSGPRRRVSRRDPEAVTRLPWPPLGGSQCWPARKNALAGAPLSLGRKPCPGRGPLPHRSPPPWPETPPYPWAGSLAQAGTPCLGTMGIRVHHVTGRNWRNAWETPVPQTRRLLKHGSDKSTAFTVHTMQRKISLLSTMRREQCDRMQT